MLLTAYWRRALSAHVLRWLAFGPLSLLALSSVLVIGQLVVPRLLGVEVGFARELVTFGTVSFLAPFALMLVGAIVAPACQRLVGVGMAALCVMFHVSIWPISLDNPMTQATFFQSAFMYTLGFVATSIGIFLAWCLCKQFICHGSGYTKGRHQSSDGTS